MNEIPFDEMRSNKTKSPLLKKIFGHKILDLKTNHIPKGLVPLERLFERNDTSLKPEKQMNQAEVGDFNIGTDKDPKIVKLSKSLSNEERERCMDLMKEFKDVFAWSYEDLGTFDTKIMQHKIPLKEGVKPFQ